MAPSKRKRASEPAPEPKPKRTTMSRSIKPTPTAKTSSSKSTATRSVTKPAVASTSTSTSTSPSSSTNPHGVTSKSKTKSTNSNNKPAIASTSTTSSSSKNMSTNSSKPIERITIDSSDSNRSTSDDSDLVIREQTVPIKSSKTSALSRSKKTIKPTSSAAAKLPSAAGVKVLKTSSNKLASSTSSSKEARAARSPEPSTSTSTPPPPSTDSRTKSSIKSTLGKVTIAPVRSLTWEEQCRQWFGTYANEDDEETIDFDGIQELFDDMDVSLAEVTALVLSWKLNAEKFGSYAYADWQRALRPASVKSSSELKSWLAKAEKELWPAKPTPISDQLLHQFYNYLFAYMMPTGQKALPGDLAITIWELVLSPRFGTAKALVAYGQSFEEGKFRGVSKDVYTQTWDFMETVSPDLEGWSEEDAWPSTIDAFVEWQQEQLKVQ